MPGADLHSSSSVMAGSWRASWLRGSVQHRTRLLSLLCCTDIVHIAVPNRALLFLELSHIDHYYCPTQNIHVITVKCRTLFLIFFCYIETISVLLHRKLLLLLSHTEHF